MKKSDTDIYKASNLREITRTCNPDHYKSHDLIMLLDLLWVTANTGWRYVCGDWNSLFYRMVMKYIKDLENLGFIIDEEFMVVDDVEPYTPYTVTVRWYVDEYEDDTINNNYNAIDGKYNDTYTKEDTRFYNARNLDKISQTVSIDHYHHGYLMNFLNYLYGTANEGKYQFKFESGTLFSSITDFYRKEIESLGYKITTCRKDDKIEEYTVSWECA